MKHGFLFNKLSSLKQTVVPILGILAVIPVAGLAQTDYGYCTVYNGANTDVYDAGYYEWHSFPSGCPSGSLLSHGSHRFKGDATRGMVLCGNGISATMAAYTKSYGDCSCYQVQCAGGSEVSVSGGTPRSSSSAAPSSSSNYVDSWEEYFTEVKLIGGTESTAKRLTQELENDGWTRINQDLNAGAGGDYIYLFYKKSDRKNPNGGYITDFAISTTNSTSMTINGRTYYRVPHDGDDHFKKYGGNLNSYTKKSSTNMWLYYTTADFSDNRAVYDVYFNNDCRGSVNKMDLNKGAGGYYIYMHQSTTTKTNRPSSDPVMASGLVYNGNSQSLIQKPATLWDGKMYYRLDSSNSYTTDYRDVKAKDAGTYTVYYYAGSTSYSKASPTKSHKVTISK